MDWTNLAQYTDQRWAFVNTVINLLVPQNAENVLSDRATVGFSRSSLPLELLCKMYSSLYNPMLSFRLCQKSLKKGFI
jgi:hypothetical protein